MTKYLSTAIKAAEVAAEIGMRYYGNKPKVEIKADQSPVTIADREIEYAVIKTVSKVFPNHGFLGEETGLTNKDADFLWIIDPIDGTKNFIDGIPLWGNLIALMHNGEIIAGVSNIPAMGELLWAEKGKGAFLNDKRVRVSKRNKLDQSSVSYGSLYAFKKAGKYRKVLTLIDSCKRQRCFGDCWPYHLLAAGKIDIVVESAINVYDIAPFDIIIREAGGKVSDLEGKKLSTSINGFLATNGQIHDSALNIVN